MYPSKILLIGNFLDPAQYSPGVNFQLARMLQDNDWQVITVSKHKNRLLRLVDMVGTVIKRRREYQVAQVDIFSGLAFFWGELSCLALRFVNKPYVLTLHGGNLPAFANRWPGRVRRLLSSASFVSAPSRFLYVEMQPYCQSLTFLPNPIHLSSYIFKHRKKVQHKLVWLRAFHQIYNPHLAPRVLAILSDDFPSLELTMVGPDKGDGSLAATQKLSIDLGVDSRIIYSGAVPKSKVPEVLQSGDIFMNTTSIDNTPISVMEAMACGLCIVSTNVGGIRHLLDHEEDALLVPPDDPDAMAEAVRRIITDPNLAYKLSINARKKVEQFDWPTILPRWEEILNAAKESDVQIR